VKAARLIIACGPPIADGTFNIAYRMWISTGGNAGQGKGKKMRRVPEEGCRRRSSTVYVIQTRAFETILWAGNDNRDRYCCKSLMTGRGGDKDKGEFLVDDKGRRGRRGNE